MIKVIVLIFGLGPSLVLGSDLDVIELLQRDLGEDIQLISKTDIRYCPDNTCEMYLALKPHEDFASYVYLHLFHRSGYIYLNLDFNGKKSFRMLAVEEPMIRKLVSGYCPSKHMNATCILESMSKTLGFYNGFGRYDEGNFCYGYNGLKNVGECTKL